MDVDELRVRIHLQQRFDARGVVRVLQHQSSPTGHEGRLAHDFAVGLLPLLLFRFIRVEQHVAIEALKDGSRKVVAMVRRGGQARKTEFLLLGKVHTHLHVVHHPLVGQQASDELLEGAVPAQDHAAGGENRLQGRQITQPSILADDVMQMRGAAAPVTDDEDRVFLQPGVGHLAAVEQPFQQADRKRHRRAHQRQHEGGNVGPAHTSILQDTLHQIGCTAADVGMNRQPSLMVVAHRHVLIVVFHARPVRPTSWPNG